MTGGNTGRMVANLHALRNPDGSMVDKRSNAAQQPLKNVLRNKTADGIPIIGVSAGLNVMCADVRTTNDMQAAVQIRKDGSLVLRIDALGLLPPHLSTNPHYQDPIEVTDEERREILEIAPGLDTFFDPQRETLHKRFEEVLEMDRERVILTLRPGAYIKVEGMQTEMRGTTGGVIFRHQKEPHQVQSGDRLDHLLLR